MPLSGVEPLNTTEPLAAYVRVKISDRVKQKEPQNQMVSHMKNTTGINLNASLEEGTESLKCLIYNIKNTLKNHVKTQASIMTRFIMGGCVAFSVCGYVGAAVRPAECIPSPGKTPPWFSKLNVTEQKKLSSNSNYQDWLKTTLDLCINFPDIQNQNYEKIIWRAHDLEHAGMLYYGAGSHHYEYHDVFKNGLAPIDFSGSLQIRNGAGSKSALKSTSFSFERAFLFSLEAKNQTRYVYVINAPGGIAVDETIDPTLASLGEAEVAFVGGLRPEFVKGVFILGDQSNNSDVVIAQYIPNPNYFDATAGIEPNTFDIMTSTDDPRVRLKLSPEGIVKDVNTTRYPIFQKVSAPTQIIARGSKNETINWSRTRTSEHVKSYYLTMLGAKCALIYSDTIFSQMMVLNASLNPASYKGNLASCRNLGPLSATEIHQVTATVSPDVVGSKTLKLSVKWTLPTMEYINTKGYRIYSLDQSSRTAKVITTVLGSHLTHVTVEQEQAKDVDFSTLKRLAISSIFNTSPESESFVNNGVSIEVKHLIRDESQKLNSTAE